MKPGASAQRAAPGMSEGQDAPWQGREPCHALNPFELDLSRFDSMNAILRGRYQSSRALTRAPLSRAIIPGRCAGALAPGFSSPLWGG